MSKDIRVKKQSPWISQKRSDSESKDDKKSGESHDKSSRGHESNSNKPEGSRDSRDNRPRSSSGKTQSRPNSLAYRPRGNSANQHRSNSGSSSANWRERGPESRNGRPAEGKGKKEGERKTEEGKAKNGNMITGVPEQKCACEEKPKEIPRDQPGGAKGTKEGKDANPVEEKKPSEERKCES